MKYIVIFLFLPLSLYSQPGYRVFQIMDPSLRSLSIGVQSGASSYFGDLSTTTDSYRNINLSFGISTKLRLNDYIFTNLDVNYYRIESKDHIIKRNLSFRSDNIEVISTYNFEFLNYNTFNKLKRQEFPLGLYLFFGIGFTTNNPMTLYKNQWVELRPLKTENVEYNPISLVFPIGVGISYQITKNFNLCVNSGYRFTNTDYLDDVSNVYVEPNQLPSDLSRDLMYRGTKWYGPKSKRGNPNQNDGYLITNLKLEYKLPITTNNFLFFYRNKPQYR